MSGQNLVTLEHYLVSLVSSGANILFNKKYEKGPVIIMGMTGLHNSCPRVIATDLRVWLERDLPLLESLLENQEQLVN